LEEQQAKRLKALAQLWGISMAEVIRRFVARGLDQTTAASRAELYAQAATIIGRFPDREQASDLADQHDRYLEEAFG
jgi:hypothetical protein